jgi:hypothetical protein
MFSGLTTRVVIVPIFLVAFVVPVSVSAQTRRPAPPLVVNIDEVLLSPNGAFVLDTIEQARTQVALAQLALSDASASDTRILALQAGELWSAVDARLHKLAQALGIPIAVERGTDERVELNRLEHVKEPDFDSAYARLVTRSCDALLERMSRMDPQVDSRVLFFVDDMLPRFGRLQIGIRNRHVSPVQTLP